MGEKKTDLLRGTLDLLILKALSLEPLHGVGISRRITQVTTSRLLRSPSGLMSDLSPNYSHGSRGKLKFSLPVGVHRATRRRIIQICISWRFDNHRLFA